MADANDELGAETKLDRLIDELGGATDFDWGADELDEVSPEIPVLRFEVAGAPVAIEGRFVREVVGDVQSTPLPGAPDYIRGISVHRRQVIGLLDLGRWLGLERELSRTDRIVIIDSGSLSVGVMVDDVTGIEPWPESEEASSLPDNVSPKLRRFARGARWAPGGVIVLLDAERILEEAAVR